MTAKARISSDHRAPSPHALIVGSGTGAVLRPQQQGYSATEPSHLTVCVARVTDD